MKAKGKRQKSKGKSEERLANGSPSPRQAVGGYARTWGLNFCLLTFAFCLLPSVFFPALKAEPIASLHATAYVNDFAGVIDASSKQQIEALCTQLDRKTAAQITVVTIKSLDGNPVEDYANALFRAWGIGRKENKGALVLIVVQDHKDRVEIGYGLEPLLPDGFDGSVLRAMRPQLSQGQWGPGLNAGVLLLAQRVAEKSGVTIDGNAPPPATQRRGRQSSGISWIQIVIFIIIILLFLSRSGGFWYFGGGGWGGGGGVGGGGGGDSGGGFGGFGGGDSGGGGASGDF
jgi:uncharacterized protein